MCFGGDNEFKIKRSSALGFMTCQLGTQNSSERRERDGVRSELTHHEIEWAAFASVLDATCATEMKYKLSGFVLGFHEPPATPLHTAAKNVSVFSRMSLIFLTSTPLASTNDVTL